MADELTEINVESRNRFPTAGRRIERAGSTLSPGAMFPRLTALLSPKLMRERGDTNALLEDAFADDGPLARIASSNPELVNEIRQQASNPLNIDQHRQLRSSILGMVSSEAERETKIRSTLVENESFLKAFVALDASIPGIKDPERFTFEEAERKQILGQYQQAQEMALLDPEGSKAIMAEVRKKADALTSNVRTFMEQTRKRAILEDISLYSTSDNTMQLLRDAQQSLTKAIESGDPVPEFVLQKALQAYGAAGSMQLTNLGDVGGQALGEAVGGGVGGATGGGLPGAGIGIVTGAALGAAGGLVNYFKDKKKVLQLSQGLHEAGAQVAANYESNRAKLKQRYQQLGIEFGAEPGDVAAVLDANYRAEADKIPTRASTPEADKGDKTETLRLMLEDESAAAASAVEKLSPEASANMPGASARLAAAVARQQNASDDLAIFEDDQRAAAGLPEPDAEDARSAVAQARARRRARNDAASRGQVRSAIQEALRSRLR